MAFLGMGGRFLKRESYLDLMNYAYLQALEIIVDLQPHQSIWEPGVVTNLAHHITITNRDYGHPPGKSIRDMVNKYGSLKEVQGGVCDVHTEPSPSVYSVPRETCVLAVAKSVPMIEWLTLGEEETHALEQFDQVERLEEVMTQFGLTLDISAFPGSEKDGHYLQKLGGFFALLRKGYDLTGRDFTENFTNTSTEIIGAEGALYCLEVLLEIKNNINVNMSRYLQAINSLGLIRKPSS